MIRNFVNKMLRKSGYVSVNELKIAQADMLADKTFMKLYKRCKPFTMTSMERLYALYEAVLYVVENRIEGDLVECGVWKGGSAMMMALTLMERSVTDRQIYLYDTFEGMSEPTQEDKTFHGDDAGQLLKIQEKKDDKSIWCYAPLEEVEKNISNTGYPLHCLRMVKGKVEETLFESRPGKVSILRLDTDWYVSTKIELEVLYPLLSEKGVLIIDDFGHWEGAKKAVLEYFKDYPCLLQRIDNTGRILVK